jgi:hypothetical protein
MTYAPLGSISSGTLRPADLIRAFADALAECIENAEPHDLDLADLAALEALQDDLQEFAPPFCYFGAHAGDGADFGFWLDQNALDEAISSGEVLKIPAGNSWPEDAKTLQYADYILEVNDHGNMTLYDLDHNEIWSIV